MNFPDLVGSSHAKDQVLILAIKTTLLIPLHQCKEGYRVSIKKKKENQSSVNGDFLPLTRSFAVFYTLI